LILLITLILLAFLLTIAIFTVIIRNRDKNPVAPDYSSIQRVQTLNELLRSYFGVHWPIVIVGILLLILLILILLFFFTKKEITLPDSSAKIINIVTILIFIIVSVLVALAFYKLYQKEKTAETDNDVQTSRDKLVLITGAVLIVIFVLLLSIAGIGFVVRRLKASRANR